MKRIYKKEFALAAGLSYRTVQKWFQRESQALRRLGVSPRGQLLTPAALKYLCEKYDVEL